MLRPKPQLSFRQKLPDPLYHMTASAYTISWRCYIATIANLLDSIYCEAVWLAILVTAWLLVSCRLIVPTSVSACAVILYMSETGQVLWGQLATQILAVPSTQNFLKPTI